MDYDNDRTRVHTSRTSGPMHDGGAPPSTSLNILPNGTKLREFEIKDLIGEGGFGIVYLAYDHSLQRHVALKEYMPSGLAARTQEMHVTMRSQHYEETFFLGLKSFINEARMLARFDSPSLVKVYRFWEENGTAYMAMPFYDGMTLTQALKAGDIVPDEEWIRALLGNLFDALEMIHREQCFHRDIAPDNILLLKDGRPLLLDFGAARRVIGDITQGPTVIFKPGFAPIEQYADIPGLRQGAWTDVYALAAVVYYLITGKAPVPAVSRVVHDNMVPAREAGRGRFSDTFLCVIDHALAVKPEYRIQSIAQMRQDLHMEEAGPRTLPPSAGMVPPEAISALDRNAPPFRTGSKGATGSGTVPNRETDDWTKTLVTDRRPMPPPKSRGRTGIMIGSLLLGGAIAVFGYRWIDGGMNRSIVAKTETSASPSATAFAEMQGPGPGSASAVTNAAPAVEGTTPAQKAAPLAPRPMITAESAPSAPPQPATLSSAPSVASAEEESWYSAMSIDSADAYQTYLKRYPRGKYAMKAKQRFDSKVASSKLPPVPSAGTPAPAAPTAADAGGNAKTAAVAASTGNATKPATAPIAGTTVSGPGGGRSAGTEPGSSSLPASASSQIATRAQADANTPSAPRAASSGGAPSGSSAASAASDDVRSAAAPQDKPDTSQKVASIPDANKAGSTRPERAREEQPKQPEQREVDSGPVIKLTFPGQTMIGTFAPDPATGLISGVGQIQFANGDRFEGRLIKGKKEGKGRFVWGNGQEYSGGWSGDKPNGKGVLKFPNGDHYDGDIRDGERHGQGTIRFGNGDVFTGTWVKDVANGRGTFRFASGDRYEGEVRNGQPTGQGTTHFRSGDVYQGSWLEGKRHGQGRYTWKKGDYWEGEFRDGRQTENGRLVRVEDGLTPATANAPVAASGKPQQGQVAETSGN